VTELAALTLAVVAVACGGGGPTGDASATTTAAPTTTAPIPPTPATAPGGADPCAALEGPIATGRLDDPELDEVSGAAVATSDPRLVWLLEDSGNPPVLTAVSARGRTVTTVTLPVEATDWEDLAAGPGPDGRPHLFVADIGDNAAARDVVTVLRLPEPDAADPVAPAVERLQLRVTGGPADAEALLVDPERGDLVVVTKDPAGRARVRVAAGAATGPAGPVDLVDAGVLELGLLEAVLAGDASADAGIIAVRTPLSLRVWSWPPGTPLVDALVEGTPCEAPSVTDPFGEALAVAPDGALVLTGEGAGATLWRVAAG
jgi:hypothetical protein